MRFKNGHADTSVSLFFSFLSHICFSLALLLRPTRPHIISSHHIHFPSLTVSRAALQAPTSPPSLKTRRPPPRPHQQQRKLSQPQPRQAPPQSLTTCPPLNQRPLLLLRRRRLRLRPLLRRPCLLLRLPRRSPLLLLQRLQTLARRRRVACSLAAAVGRPRTTILNRCA